VVGDPVCPRWPSTLEFAVFLGRHCQDQAPPQAVRPIGTAPGVFPTIVDPPFEPPVHEGLSLPLH